MSPQSESEAVRLARLEDRVEALESVLRAAEQVTVSAADSKCAACQAVHAMVCAFVPEEP